MRVCVYAVARVLCCCVCSQLAMQSVELYELQDVGNTLKQVPLRDCTNPPAAHARHSAQSLGQQGTGLPTQTTPLLTAA